jgi:hypothetical protein
MPARAPRGLAEIRFADPAQAAGVTPPSGGEAKRKNFLYFILPAP